MRQGHVLEERTDKRTFGEAKTNLPEYDSASIGSGYAEPMYNEHSFLEIDEDESYEAPVYKSNYSTSDSKVRYDEDPQLLLQQQQQSHHKVGQTVRSADSFLNDSLPEYSHPGGAAAGAVGGCVGPIGGRKDRPRRRRSSKETIDASDVPVSSNDDEPASSSMAARRKPETMRSISEDVPARTAKPVTRRTLSHPEKESQVCVKLNASVM